MTALDEVGCYERRSASQTGARLSANTVGQTYVILTQSGEESGRHRFSILWFAGTVRPLVGILCCIFISGCTFWPLARKSVTQAERAGVDPVSVAGRKSEGAPNDLTTQKKTSGGDKTDTNPTEPRSQGKEQASSSDGSSQSEPEFKKHDHAQYVKTIKNKAIDVLNKQPNSTQAIFCTDRVTERRSLTIYFKRQKSYSFTYYEWDDVDQEMKEIFSAEKVPISRWKEHLQYADQDKECSILKGEDLR